ncbi:MAG: sigma-70 family RNA polymerase sigma factor [Verrucomicrobia bacterium]|nr:sigma-70 family RNA polymerase sigma factor [Verrucomicrobiota bacterium]
MPSDVTQLLSSIESGDPKAAEELLPLVYEELRRLAAHKMANERPGQTLQATALVHEAWVKLAGSSQQQWRGRSHFFGAAAEAMRRILIDKARRRTAQKRGDGIQLEKLNESRIELRAPPDEILAVSEALDQLAKKEPVSAEVVKLKYFVGMTLPEIAEALDVSLSTVERHWSFAKAWLRTAVRGDSGANAPSG